MKDDLLRNQLLQLLTGEQAHMKFDEAVANFPKDQCNTKPPHVSYTPWHLLEHLRITQKDILDFILEKNYKELKWPDDYWPKQHETADTNTWNKTIENFLRDNESLKDIVNNPKRDMLTYLSWGKPYTIFREIVVVSNHNSYHIGEFSVLREVMGTWPKNRKK